MKSVDISLENLSGMKITVMGLGLNGGGLNAARFFASRGAIVTVTDMKDEKALAPSIAELATFPVRYVLGRHEIEDFSTADIVIKNPAVRPDSPYLLASRHVETDLSVFLRFCPGEIIAISGSKGKSGVASAIHHILKTSGQSSYLGGNIAISPLSFLEELKEGDKVVLELSSWQLGDLKDLGLLRPGIAVLTRIVPDHLDRYGSMEAYVNDKRLIYRDQKSDGWTIVEADSDWGKHFASETPARVLYYGMGPDGGPKTPGAYLLEDGSGRLILPDGKEQELFPAPGPLEALHLQGTHSRRNMLAAGLAAWAAGTKPEDIPKAISSFPGIEHRLEAFLDHDGLQWVNDSAATVPEAVLAALDSFHKPVTLISGGTDKELDFEPARAAYARAETLILLEGSASDKLIPILREDGVEFLGPCASIEEAVALAAQKTRPGSVVILSPGATSFGMFKNEFDRGRCFKAAVKDYYRL